MSVTLIAVAVLTGGGLTALFLHKRRIDRLATFAFPAHIIRKVQSTYPHLTPEDCELVMRGLRQFFAVATAAHGRRVAMPSQAVDTAWHEFILSTRAYQGFCRQVLGRFLHHTPAEAMRTPRLAQDGIRRAWRLACRNEGVNPKAPDRLPLLFALDSHLAIPGGFFYSVDCRRVLGAHTSAAADTGGGGTIYCASDIGCSGGGSWGDGGGGDGDGDGDGGGCGGD